MHCIGLTECSYFNVPAPNTRNEVEAWLEYVGYLDLLPAFLEMRVFDMLTLRLLAAGVCLSFSEVGYAPHTVLHSD